MDYRHYIDGSIAISRLGFGAWPLGGKHHGQQMPIEDGVGLVQAAFNLGINFFDTAPNYGLGLSETILGIALKDVRKNVVINSKFGHHEDDTYDFSEMSIRSSVERSLERLQTNYLDSLLLHNPSMEILKGKTKHFEVLEQLKSEGILRGYGVSIDTAIELDTVLNNIRVDVIELLYNVFFQSTRDLLCRVKEKGIALIIKVPLDSGWLTGSYSEKTVFSGIKKRWTSEDIQRRSNLVNQLKEIATDGSLNDYAIGFLLSYDAVTTIIPGVRSIDQLSDHLRSSKFQMDLATKNRLEEFYDIHIKNNPLPW